MSDQSRRTFLKRAAALGLLQLYFPEDHGGIAGVRFDAVIVGQELARAG